MKRARNDEHGPYLLPDEASKVVEDLVDLGHVRREALRHGQPLPGLLLDEVLLINKPNVCNLRQQRSLLLTL